MIDNLPSEESRFWNSLAHDIRKEGHQVLLYSILVEIFHRLGILSWDECLQHAVLIMYCQEFHDSF